jgi:hypothetical protein
MPIYFLLSIEGVPFRRGFEPNTQNPTPKGAPFYIASSLGNNHRGVRERNISGFPESAIETCQLYQWVSLPRDASFRTDPRHGCPGEVAGLKHKKKRTMKTTRTQKLLAAALVGALALTTTHAQTAPKMKITTGILDRRSEG